MDHFINEHTLTFFQRYNINTAFLSQNPSTWKDDEDYVNAWKMLQKLQVGNDHAERGVKLLADFNFLLTKEETERQYLLQVVEEYRGKRGPLTEAGLSEQYSTE